MTRTTGSLDAGRIRIWTADVARRAQPVPGSIVDRLLADAPLAYVEDCTPATAAHDVVALHGLEPGQVGVHLEPDPRADSAASGRRVFRFRIRAVAAEAPLYRVLPVLQSMGVDAIDERAYWLGTGTARVYDLAVALPAAANPTPADVERVVDTFDAAFGGESEVDGFNRLVLAAGLDHRQVGVLRAYAGYLRQAGLPYTRRYVETVLTDNASVARALAELFDAQFPPPGAPAPAGVEEAAARAADAVEAVAGLDADRIVRSLLTAITATTRTNLHSTWVRPRRALAIKLDPRHIPFLPDPRPRFEVYVHGPDVEGVHLRFDLISRGGLRWSERPDDFRTEILGLVKAQSVKNAVIVPAGAKGGFVVKCPTPGPDDVERCYREFVACLLDLTDDRDLRTGRVVPAPGVHRRDGDDPYLVVAADKGTARLSDAANAAAVGRGFWLGDAFASGGAEGYDHKAMGITARGAWESVTRHFREIGVDIATAPFTAVGIGDMSGDVFGNGMLLARTLRLVAAFDHRHVVVDPDPEPEASWRERARLFALPRSSWADYDPAVLSRGALVVPRTAKAVTITPEVRRALGMPGTATTVTAHELVRAVLAAPVDLLWNGGVGTYVKASIEHHLDCGDKANDPVRVDATELRARVVGEGGNLGITQRGRTEFARCGGRVNTDALDNSAGVDCSDHEVNIKIALAGAVRSGRLTAEGRRALLAGMTGEVARRVLADNTAQNELMGANRAEAPRMLGFHARIVERLEQVGALDRAVDLLPSPAGFTALSRAGSGLSSPELAQLSALVKNDLQRRLLDTTVPDEPAFAPRLRGYFPDVLVETYGGDIDAHPLRREIVATSVVNDLVDHGGNTFAFRMREDTPADIADIARAFHAAMVIFGLDEVFAAIRACGAGGGGGAVPVAATDALAVQTRRLLDRAARWLITKLPAPLDVPAAIARYRSPIARYAVELRSWMRGDEVGNLDDRTTALVDVGAPVGLACRVADLLHLFSYLDVVDLAHDLGRPFPQVARVYYAASARLHIHTHLTAVSRLDRHDRSHALARLSLREDLYASVRAATADIVRTTPDDLAADERLTRWGQRKDHLLRSARTTPVPGAEQADLADLCAAARQIRLTSR